MAEGQAVARRATAGGLAAFVLLGMVQAAYGPAVPALRKEFDLGAAAAGLVLSAHFAGAMAGIVLTGLAERRAGPRLRLTAGTLLLGSGCAGLVTAPAWPLVLAAAFVVGLGFGSLDLGFSALFAAGFGGRSAAMSNLLHACFGVGAVLGPIAIGLVGERAFRLPLGMAAVLAAVLVPLTLAAPVARPRAAGGEPARGAPALPVTGLLSAFALMYLLYTGTETSVGGWEPTHLIEVGYSEAGAARLTAAFWGAVLLGRLLSVPLSLRVRPERMVVGSAGLGAAFLALANVPALAPAAYALGGLAFAPFFPTGMVWLLRRLPETRGAAAAVIGAANVGAIMMPAAVGGLITATGARAVPMAAAAGAVATLLCALALSRAGRTQPR